MIDSYILNILFVQFLSNKHSFELVLKSEIQWIGFFKKCTLSSVVEQH